MGLDQPLGLTFEATRLRANLPGCETGVICAPFAGRLFRISPPAHGMFYRAHCRHPAWSFNAGRLSGTVVVSPQKALLVTKDTGHGVLRKAASVSEAHL